MTATYDLISEQVLSSAASSVTPLYDLYDMPHRHYLVDTLVTEEGCWILKGNRTAKNYTIFTLNRKVIPAHRYMWQYEYGEIPNDMVVDHVCHNEAVARGECKGGDDCRHRPCFNPEHLQLATPLDNVMSGARNYWSKTHCPRGHERTEENTVLMIDSRFENRRKKVCRLCRNERSLAAYHRMMARKGGQS